jgi:hypothetical protein
MHGKLRELIYNFPIEAPMMLHINGYQAGNELGFVGSSHYLITCCGMSTFAVMKPITNANATMYASAIIKIILCFGFCHTAILNKDSKFFGKCLEALDLLQINCHVLSRSNHNPMLVKWLNRYLNQDLRIICNKHDSNRVTLEAILLLIYKWNSCHVPGTKISHCMVAIGCKFAFPINFSTSKHAQLYGPLGTVISYSKMLPTWLESCRSIAMLLVREQCSWHCKLINSRCRNPPIYTKGNIVFARHGMQSNAKQGCVNKLMHPFTGSWWIVKSLPGASYEIECLNTSRQDKKHASNLLPYPPELNPFQPVNTADN